MARAIDPFTGSKGYQGRTFEEDLSGPHTIDPFQGNALARLRGYGQDVADYGARLRLQNAPSVDTAMPAIVRVPIESVPRDMPTTVSETPMRSAGLGPRARPIFRNNSGLLPVTDFAAEREKRTIPIPLYRGEDVRVSPTAMRGQTDRSVQLTPEQQAIVDAFWDEQARWTGTDELGNVVHRGTRYNGDMMDIGTMRAIQQVEADDAMRAAELEAARQAARPKPRVRI